MSNKKSLSAVDLFLSIQAQDFIEDNVFRLSYLKARQIPEHSSSGLH